LWPFWLLPANPLDGTDWGLGDAKLLAAGDAWWLAALPEY